MMTGIRFVESELINADAEHLTVLTWLTTADVGWFMADDWHCSARTFKYVVANGRTQEGAKKVIVLSKVNEGIPFNQ